ncbi:MAG: hypothetical protein IT322_06070 [Anaerolineae bacterium]|nr:hypothetical protein [Anaerolineae bacterium]
MVYSIWYGDAHRVYYGTGCQKQGRWRMPCRRRDAVHGVRLPVPDFHAIALLLNTLSVYLP